jgi:signal transduction histidine kinase
MTTHDDPAANPAASDPRMDSGGLARAIATGLCTIAGAKAGFLLALDQRHQWFVEAATPSGAELPDETLAAIAAELSGDEVTHFENLPGIVPGEPGAASGLAIRISADPAHPRILATLGLGQPDHHETAVVAIQTLAVLATAALSRAGIHTQDAAVTRSRAASLVAAGMVLSADLNLDDVLQRLVETAREVLGARYAALGVLDAEGTRLDRFVTTGVTERERRSIGPPPVGRGLLGLLFTHQRPIRIDSIAGDPRSAGFPPNHPPMTTFLGVPIRVGTEVFGNLYVTDKLAGPFTEEDEFVALTLAAQAAVAIANARRFGQQELAALRAALEREHAAEEGLRRAIGAQEAERARIARELHDEAGQELTALALQLRAMDDHVTDERGRAGLATARQTLARTAANLRELALELRPSGLKEHGLASAIERQAARLRESSAISVAVALDAIPDSLPEPVEIALFRVVQEALTNIARHSGARHASVTASVLHDRLRVVVEDDGRGFDPTTPTDRLGLAGMRERMDLIGGAVRVESVRRAGTTVIFELEVAHG